MDTEFFVLDSIAKETSTDPPSKNDVRQSTRPQREVDQHYISVIKECKHLEWVWGVSLHHRGGEVSIEILDKCIIKTDKIVG